MLYNTAPHNPRITLPEPNIFVFWNWLYKELYGRNFLYIHLRNYRNSTYSWNILHLPETDIFQGREPGVFGYLEPEPEPEPEPKPLEK